jgi:PTH1 family peptidyl-tRNA hydrolase
MNLSGFALNDLIKKTEIPLHNTLIIYDDVNLDLGVLRFRPKGSDGGHNGMKSVIYELNTDNIPRLRIGIRNFITDIDINKYSSADDNDLADYVLSDFNKDEQIILDKILNVAKDAVLCFIFEGINAAMNLYNKKFFDLNKSI